MGLLLPNGVSLVVKGKLFAFLGSQTVLTDEKPASPQMSVQFYQCATGNVSISSCLPSATLSYSVYLNFFRGSGSSASAQLQFIFRVL